MARLPDTIAFVQSRNLADYEPILTGLADDFGTDHHPAIHIWCDAERAGDFDYWQVFLVKLGDKTVGTCGLYSLRESTEELWLAWFGVLKPYRRMGIGVKSLDFLVGLARSVGCRWLMSYVDRKGEPLPFYFKYGFREQGRVLDYLAEHPDVDRGEFGNLDDYVICLDLETAKRA